MGQAYTGTGAHWDWYSMEKSIHMDLDNMGQVYTGTGTQ